MGYHRATIDPDGRLASAFGLSRFALKSPGSFPTEQSVLQVAERGQARDLGRRAGEHVAGREDASGLGGDGRQGAATGPPGPDARPRRELQRRHPEAGEGVTAAVVVPSGACRLN